MLEDIMSRAYQLATKSPDESNQNGAVIVDLDENTVVGFGYNHFPHGIKPVQTRPEKYKRIQHAERDAILSGWGSHVVKRAMMVCPWAACCDCALAIIGTNKIVTLVTHGPRMRTTPDRWKDDVEYALNMIREAGIEIIELETPIPGAPKIIVNGELWQP
jgi:deoxycytidylate deaminase